ncbi:MULTISPECIES: trypco2 family protein [unclassified Streptomyces]|uniref:trypco2 family protein n=1 Tax=unclassified Streptomyces TaxID=2593676 RepID=UPI00403CFE51
MTGAAEDTSLELPVAVREVRAALQRAMTEGEGEELKFEVGSVEMEFDVQMTSSQGGGVKIYVLEGKVDRASAVRHRLKVTLTPRDANGQSPLVSGSTALIPPA